MPITLDQPYSDEPADLNRKEQIKAIQWLEKNKSEFYRRIKKPIEQTVSTYWPDEYNANSNKSNPFTYVIPREIFIENKPNPRVAVFFNYKYDPEHGLAVAATPSNWKIEVAGEGDLDLF